MSKGLDALKDIKSKPFSWEKLKDSLDIIEKELKALEIIKKYYSPKECDDDLFPYYLEEKQYVSSRSGNIMTKKEFELLKEVLQ